MKKLHIVMLALATASASTVALAQTAAAGARPKPDANGDGVITRDEAAQFPRLAARFDTLDKNKDGKLSGDELSGWKPGGKADREDTGSRMMDPERKANREKMRAECFDKADANKDGQLSRDEFNRMGQVCGQWRGERHHPPMTPDGPAPAVPGKK